MSTPTTTDSNKIKLRFHYWNCRGRVQTIRYMLEDIAYKHKNVDYKEDFQDVGTVMTTWAEVKPNQTITGPYRTLPVLHWNDKDTFGQTLTIGLLPRKTKEFNFIPSFCFPAHFLSRKFDLYGKVTSKYTDPIVLEGYINGVVACAYTDIIEKVLLCLFSKPDIDNKNSPEYYPIKNAQDNIESLNMLLKQSSTSFFYDQTEPTVADYFAFEAYLVLHDIQPKLLPKNSDALAKLQQIMKERPALADYFKNGKLFKHFTAAPDEEGYLAKIA